MFLMKDIYDYYDQNFNNYNNCIKSHIYDAFKISNISNIKI
jgi:hypothetical protein